MLAAQSAVGRFDVIVHDAAGNVVSDTKAERKTREDAFAQRAANKAPKSPILRRVLASSRTAASDSANELVHLYEVRDALAEHYGGEKGARATLGIPASEWDRLGRLANDPAIAQGRHRGRKVGPQREATVDELTEVRSIVRDWVERLVMSI